MTATRYQRPLPAVLNIFSNMAGGGWIAVLTVITTPVQVNILGMEGYGLISFIVTLQAICNVLDFGLSATLTRELAMDHSAGVSNSRPLVQAVRTVYWVLALCWGVILFFGARSLCQLWFKPVALDPEVLVFGLQIMAIYLALRWPVAFYSSILSGLQRMDLLNLLKASASSLRLIGGLVVLLIYKDLVVFLWWTLLNIFLEVLAYAVVCRKVYAMVNWRWNISWSVLQPIWRYALKMNAIGLLAVLLAQADRLQVSKLLSMETLGFYSLAYTTVSSVSLILGAISSALLPSFSLSHSRDSLDSLVGRYYNFSSMTLFLTGFIIFALMFFGQFILSLWVSPQAATGAWQPLAWLAGGFWFSVACSNAYTIAVSCGRPDLPLKISLLSALPYFFVIPMLIKHFAINGPAMAWLMLNVFYIFSLVPLVHRKVLKTSVISWLSRVFLPFTVLGVVSFGLTKLIIILNLKFSVFDVALEPISFILAMFLYVILGLLLLGKDIRWTIINLVYEKVQFIW